MTPLFFIGCCLRGIAVLLSLILAVGLSYSTAAARPAVQESPSLTILLRTSDGAPVAGIQTTLRSAPVGLGGAATPLPTQEATTDPNGYARFHDLGHWVWYVTFNGAFAAHPLQPAPDQGKPPWGTNPAGDGFPVVVDSQLENEGNLPVPTADAVTAVTYPFVLVLDGATWVPGLDLADAAASPVPLDALPGMASLAVPSPVAAPTQATPSRPDLSGLLLLLAVGGAGVVALYQSWRQRTHRHAIERLPSDPITAEDRNSTRSDSPGD